PNPLRCWNCGEYGHATNLCRRDCVQRCFICWSDEHTKANCRCCRHCGEDHKGRRCPETLQCECCGGLGYNAKHCPNAGDKPGDNVCDGPAP
ncbi:uncharacterized protein THITE_2051234, partial [Thermothielavioides terrestris NRRL 8126]